MTGRTAGGARLEDVMRPEDLCTEEDREVLADLYADDGPRSEFEIIATYRERIEARVRRECAEESAQLRAKLGELVELVELWRVEAGVSAPDPDGVDACETLRECAKELEATLKEVGNG